MFFERAGCCIGRYFGLEEKNALGGDRFLKIPMMDPMASV